MNILSHSWHHHLSIRCMSQCFWQSFFQVIIQNEPNPQTAGSPSWAKVSSSLLYLPSTYYYITLLSSRNLLIHVTFNLSGACQKSFGHFQGVHRPWPSCLSPWRCMEFHGMFDQRLDQFIGRCWMLVGFGPCLKHKTVQDKSMRKQRRIVKLTERINKKQAKDTGKKGQRYTKAKQFELILGECGCQSVRSSTV